MRIGITGHQARDGIDWCWVERRLRTELASINKADEALSSLAAGSDQVFARVALSMNIPVVAVIPLQGYENFFEGDALAAYRKLCKRSISVELDWKGDEERAFFEAGKYIARQVDVLIAVWDGEKAEGFGGTADVVRFARKIGKNIVHLNPMNETIKRM